MAIGDIKPGYIGIATVSGTKVRCNDFNVNPRQEPLFYDHIVGLRDSIPSTIFGGKGDAGNLNTQKRIWRPSTKIYQGNITYPLTETISAPLYEHARRGDDFTITFDYTCGISREFTGCKVNSYTFSVTAGDIATVTAEIMATGCSDGGGGAAGTYVTEEKIVTWDDVDISSGGFDTSYIQSFSMTVNNNCMPIYTAGSNDSLDLDPAKLRVGMQMVTGVTSFYNKGNSLDFLEDISGETTLSVSTSSGFGATLNVIFRPQERSGSVSPVISPLPFVGVDKALT